MQQYKDIKVLKRVGYCAFVIELVGNESIEQNEWIVDLLAEGSSFGELENFNQNIQTISKAMQETA